MTLNVEEFEKLVRASQQSNRHPIDMATLTTYVADHAEEILQAVHFAASKLCGYTLTGTQLQDISGNHREELPSQLSPIERPGHDKV